MADEALIEPSQWRRQHDPVERLEQSIKDANEAIARPWRRLDTLMRMAQQGTISPSMREAGERFHDEFRRAGCFDGLYSADPRRIPVLSMGSNNRVWSGGKNSERAYWSIRSGLDALGGMNSPGGSCAWHVLGLEESLSQWCLRYSWGKRAMISNKIASGILIANLGILELHWGFKIVR